jgi:hypothetical protein
VQGAPQGDHVVEQVAGFLAQGFGGHGRMLTMPR